MKKRIAMIGFTCIMLGIIFLISVQNDRVKQEDTKVIRLRLAEPMSERQPAAMGAAYFCQLVREKSGGRIKIEIIYEGMGETGDILEQIKYGGLSFAQINAMDAIEQIPALEDAFQSCAYEGPESVINWAVKDQEKIIEAFRKEGMEPLVWYYPEKRCFYSSTRNINDINDFKDLKIKSCNTNLMKQSMSALGATSVYVANDDIYRSLESGYMDAGEASFSEFVLGDYYDLVEYVTISDYIASPDLIVVSESVLQDLSEEDRELLKKCARDTYFYEKEQVQSFQEEYLFRIGIKKKLFLETEDFSEQLQEVLKNTK